MASRSHFYVDTPRDPSQRHSMFVTHSELAQRPDLSSNSSSATLPSAAGSVDRLTGLEEKKSPRFFTLKPKTSFSLKPFFRSTSSLISLSPGKRRKAILERRDSYVQTEESRPEFGEVGVQTLNASTVDVPVQTCLEAWEEGDSYGKRRLAYASARTSPFWSRPSVSSSALSNSLIPQNAAKDPLASPKLVKYAAPSDSEKTAFRHQSSVSSVDVNSCQSILPPPHSVSHSSTKVPVKYFAAKELTSNAISVSVTPECQLDKKLQSDSDQKSNSVPLELKTNIKESDTIECESETFSPKGYKLVEYKAPEVSTDLNYTVSQNIEHPISALKTERTDSPSKRLRTVHFDLSGPDSPKQLKDNSLKPRNIDKDFEALLKDLNVLTDDESDLTVPIEPSSRDKCPSTNLLCPNLKSALDALREDFLDPIPETANESIESEECFGDSEESSSFNKNKNSDVNSKTEPEILNSITVESQTRLTPSVPKYEYQNKLEENKNDSDEPTSLSVFTSAKSVSNPETDSLEGNVYDNVIKEENLVKTVPLPTLPSFFEPPSQPHILETEIVEYINLNRPEILPDSQEQSVKPLETEFDLNMLSRSSSRSSIRSNSKQGCDTLREPVNRFDSCENLDQLEEEIIRSLYSPDDGKLEDNIMKNIDLPPSESFQNSGTTATHMRRVILDQLLSGKSVQDIVPNFPVYQRANSLPESGRKYKYPVKHTAVLTKMEQEDSGSPTNSIKTSQSISSNDLDTAQNLKSTNTKEIDNVVGIKHTTLNVIDSPKKTTIYMFPEDSLSSNPNQEKSVTEISTSNQQTKCPSVLEVRRSSWTSPTTSDSPRNNVNGNIDTDKEKTTDKKSEKCDFTNCLRPSKIQNSSFLAKINTRSMSPCSFSPMPTVQSSSYLNHSPTKKNNSPKPPEAIGECDYASCLKPSQVQNSLFTAELTEITANKSTNSLRTGSPLPVRIHSPLLARSSGLDIQNVSPVIGEKNRSGDICSESVKCKSELISPIIEEKNKSGDICVESGKHKSELISPIVEKENKSTNICYESTKERSELVSPTVEEKNKCDVNCSEPIKHKSELLITLQTSAKHSTDANNDKPTDFSNFDSVEKLKNTNNLGPSHNSSCATNDLETNASINSVATPPPPPPPPPLYGLKSSNNPKEFITSSMDTMIQDHKANLSVMEVPRSVTPVAPVIVELELKLQNKPDIERRNSNDNRDDQCPTSKSDHGEITNAGRSETNLNGSPYISNGNQNGSSIGFLSDQREYNSPLPNDKTNGLHGTTKLTFSPTTVVTDEPPPLGAVLLDKKVTVDGDKVHTDKYYAIPVKEVLKEKTSTTKFIPAPPKYDGIGPTEDGIPTGLRNSVKKENMHNWYKTMFKSLHKADLPNDSQEYIIGYTSEPESSKKDIMLRKKSSTLDNRPKPDVNSNYNKLNYTPTVKSSIEVYNVRPRLIEDYEPGYSSVTDDDVTLSRRYLPSKNTVKPSYEFKNGYESDSNITKKRVQPDALSTDQQKMWYREVQKGGDIPQFGLGKQAPEKTIEPSIGPVPPPPLNYNGPSTYQQAVRPLTLPADYMNQNGNGYCQQMNGAYEMQMRLAIHSEMQQRMSPSSNQLSPPNRMLAKSPSRSPDMKLQAQALFDFKAESPKEIPLKKGDMVLILRQLDKNWYEGEHKGVIGIFPISYVEIIPPEHASTPIKIKPEGLGKALYDFVAQTSIELTVRKGDSITLLRRVDANWFEGIFNNKKGIVPISYVQVIQEPVERNINSPSQKSYITSPSLSQSSEKLHKPSSISPSAYSSSSISPLPINQERRKMPSKKGINLIEPVMYRALYSYSPQNSDELELQEGDSVYVVEMCDDGWFVGTSVRSGVFGIFPGNYVEKAC